MKITVITGSRADWNPLGMVARALQDAGHDTRVWSIGTPIDALAADGWGGKALLLRQPRVHPTVWNRATETSHIISVVGQLISVATPDLVVLLGDRWEILAAATAAYQMDVPIAHLSGGDITRGSYDDSMRHAITKLATLHFVTCTDSYWRVVQMGEAEERVFNVGSPAIDRLLQRQAMTRAETMAALDLGDEDKFVVVNWQPETLASDPNAGLRDILLDVRHYDGAVVLIGSNDDRGADEADRLKRAFVHDVAHSPIACTAVFHANLPADLYYAALEHCEELIGNSSSALYEAPALGCKVRLVGDRQQGREPSASSAGASAQIARHISALTTPIDRRKIFRSRP